MRHRAMSLALVLALLLPLGGCFVKHITGNIVIDFFLTVLGAEKKPKGVKFKATPTIDFDATVQGLPSGDFDVTIGMGRYGHFTGSQKIVHQRFATVKDPGSDALKAAMANLVEDTYGQTVTITKAKATIATHETTGGVSAVFKVTITFEGTITSGPDTGKTFKKGKISGGGKFT